MYNTMLSKNIIRKLKFSSSYTNKWDLTWIIQIFFENRTIYLKRNEQRNETLFICTSRRIIESKFRIPFVHNGLQLSSQESVEIPYIEEKKNKSLYSIIFKIRKLSHLKWQLVILFKKLMRSMNLCIQTDIKYKKWNKISCS